MNPGRSLVALSVLALVAAPAPAQTRPVGGAATVPAAGAAANPAPARRSQWHGYERIDFTWAGRPCVLVLPKTAAEGKPWIWRTEFFEHEPQVDLALLARGWHVAFIDARDLYGAPRALALFNELYAHLVVHAGLARRVVLEGFSRGGLYAFNFAATHPTRVAALYLDAPVLNLRSWPKAGTKEFAQMLEAYGQTEATFAAFRGSPVDKIDRVAAAKIPIVVVAGDVDDVVPLADNAGILEKRYRELGAPIEMIVKRGVGHHPHSLEDPTPVVEWLVKNARL